jgi:hypothetical protein
MDLERRFENKGWKEDVKYQFLREGHIFEEREDGKDDPDKN